MNSETRSCQSCKKDFAIESEDFVFYEKMQVPSPTWCSHCRMLRRYIWRNERHIFRRKDDRTGDILFSGIPQQSPIKVYEKIYWNSDAFDATEYAKEYDFSRPFFQQFHELLRNVPWGSKNDLNSINSDYSDQSEDFKNTYLCFNGTAVEDSAYCVRCLSVKDSFDMTGIFNSELCYDGVNITKSYRVFYSVDVENSNDIVLSRDLLGCANCIGCAGLRKKSYYILNQPYSKEDYEKKVAELRLHTQEGLESFKKEAYKVWAARPVRFMHGIRTVESSGELISDSKNAKQCYQVSEAENVKYCQELWRAKDCYDYSIWGASSQQVYDSICCGSQVSNIKFCSECWPSSVNLEYSIRCFSSSNLFGCVGLKKKQYCILNKQYTKEEYEALVPKIREHLSAMPYEDSRGRKYTYGEFFPPEFSPFAYNETVLQDFFPLTEETAQAAGFSWREQENREFAITRNADDLPDNIEEVNESLLGETIGCRGCERAYKIIPMELAFLRRQKLPLPRYCPQCRFGRRQQFINPPRFYERGCMCKNKEHFHEGADCANRFETAYASKSSLIVYCEECYQAEVS